MKIINACPVCGKDVTKTPAVLMPFVAHRALGIEPVTILPAWGLTTVKAGASYQPCHTARCTSCGLIFCDARFDGDEAARLYDDYRGPDYVALREHYEPGYFERNALIEAMPSSAPGIEAFIGASPETVLDWGGDDGRNTPYAGAQSVCIYDIGAKPVKVGMRVRVPYGVYDLIVCASVLEHISYPVAEVGRIGHFMDADSLLYIEVPKEDATHRHHWHEHINYFSYISLRVLIEKCGLRQVKFAVDTVNGSEVYRMLCRKQ